MSKLGLICYFLSPVSCALLVLRGLMSEWGSGLLNLVLSLSLSHTGHWKFNMSAQCKELSECHESRPGVPPFLHQRSPSPFLLDSFPLTPHTCHSSHSQLFPIITDYLYHSLLPLCLVSLYMYVYMHDCSLCWVCSLWHQHRVAVCGVFFFFLQPRPLFYGDFSHRPWQNETSQQGSSREVPRYPTGRPEPRGLPRGLHGNGSPVGYREDQPHGHLLGRPGRPF